MSLRTGPCAWFKRHRTVSRFLEAHILWVRFGVLMEIVNSVNHVGLRGLTMRYVMTEPKIECLEYNLRV